MKLSLEWLSDYVTLTEKDPVAIARLITAHVAEVDDVEKQGELLEHCCVGEVLSLTKHPNADKLNVCEVQTDKGRKHVVCGGTNLRVGMRIAFAHPGARVRHGTEIVTLERVKIRGESSEGMICAAKEVDLSMLYPPKPEDGERPVIHLAGSREQLAVGMPLREALGLNDVIFHVDNHAITHRADLFSHVGFARELVAMGIARWKKQPTFSAPKFPKDALPFRFRVEEKRLIPRYCACMIAIDGLGETPAWMQRRLMAVGWRPVNLPVDITNYVATEIGVPLHSFDVDDIKGDVIMRRAKAGEHIVTLDEKERELPAGALVLSDDLGIFDMLGIMGGLRSSTKASTRRIYLHSASLDPVSIRSTVIATGHRTDAATVYEKGVPHITTEQGFLRALELFLAHAPGARVVSHLESVGDNGEGTPIAFSASHASAALGEDIEEKEVMRILEDLGCTVKQGKGNLTVTPPLWRLRDLRGAHDLVEEVGRVHGYDRIAVTMPDASTAPPERDHRIAKLRDVLVSRGYYELLPLSLLGPDLLKKCGMDPGACVRVQNAIGEEYSLMQPSLLPRMLEHAEHNMLLVDDALRTFHIGTVFDAHAHETNTLCVLLGSRQNTDAAGEPFLRLKRDVLGTLEDIGYVVDLRPSTHVSSTAHPGRSADVYGGSQCVGTLAEVHPSVAAQFDLPHRAAVLTLNLDALFALVPASRYAQPVALFPAVTYDVTFTLDRTRTLGGLIERIQRSSTLLRSVRVADLYSGKPLAPHQYNVTLRCTYRAEDRTLTEEEVKREHANVETLTHA